MVDHILSGLVTDEATAAAMAMERPDLPVRVQRQKGLDETH